MLVDVVFMRREGVKLSREELLGALRLRAKLRVTYIPSAIYAQLLFPWNGPMTPGTNVPTLKDCRIWRCVDDDLVLHGTELVGMAYERSRLPQAWWCRIVPPTT